MDIGQSKAIYSLFIRFILLCSLVKESSVLPTAMASSLQRLERLMAVKNQAQLANCSKPFNTKQPQLPVVVVVPLIPISRRCAIMMISTVLPLALISSLPQPSMARERRNRKIIPLEDYLTSCQSLPLPLQLLTFFHFHALFILDHICLIICHVFGKLTCICSQILGYLFTCYSWVGERDCAMVLILYLCSCFSPKGTIICPAHYDLGFFLYTSCNLICLI